MGVMSMLLAAAPELPSEFRGALAWLQDIDGGRYSTNAGVNVSEDSALKLPEVFAAVRNLAQDTAKLPLHLYRRLPDDGRERAKGERLYRILRLAFNDEMTSMVGRTAVMVNAALFGNGHAEIRRDGSGEVTGLWPIPSWLVSKPLRDSEGRLYYEVRQEPGKQPRHIPARDMLHIPGLTANGLVGVLPIHCAKEAIGLGMAAMTFTGSFFKNGASPSGVISVPEKLDEKALERYAAGLRTQYGGATRSGRLMVLSHAAKFETASSTARDSQLLETMQFSVLQVARYFRMPPHKLQDLSRATFSNIEQQSLEYWSDTIQPWTTLWEQELNRKLISEAEQDELYVEHDYSVLLQTDLKSRFESYAVGIRSGVLSRNEARQRENLNGYEGGDRFLVEQNVAVVNEDGGIEPTNRPEAPTAPAPAEKAPPPKTGATDFPGAAKTAMMPVFAEICGRIVAREVKTIGGFKGNVKEWAEDWYAGHLDYATAAVLPAAQALARLLGAAIDDNAVKALLEPMIEAAQKQVTATANHDELFRGWKARRAAAMALGLTDGVCEVISYAE